MTTGIDLIAAVVGITAFFTHILNKLRKLIHMSQSVLKMLFDSSDFHKHFQYLATNHRVKLVARHGSGSQEVNFLDKCTATCKDTYERLQMRLQKVQDSRFKVYRAYREKDDIDVLARLMQKSNSDLAMVVSMTSSSDGPSNQAIPYTINHQFRSNDLVRPSHRFTSRHQAIPYYDSSANELYQDQGCNRLLSSRDRGQDFYMSRFDNEVQAKVYLLESEFSSLVARLESEGKDVSAGYSKHDIAYQVDAAGEYVMRMEAKIDIPPISSAAGYYARQSMSKEVFKPFMNGAIKNVRSPLTSHSTPWRDGAAHGVDSTKYDHPQTWSDVVELSEDETEHEIDFAEYNRPQTWRDMVELSGDESAYEIEATGYDRPNNRIDIVESLQRSKEQKKKVKRYQRPKKRIDVVEPLNSGTEREIKAKGYGKRSMTYLLKLFVLFLIAVLGFAYFLTCYSSTSGHGDEL